MQLSSYFQVISWVIFPFFKNWSIRTVIFLPIFYNNNNNDDDNNNEQMVYAQRRIRPGK